MNEDKLEELFASCELTNCGFKRIGNYMVKLDGRKEIRFIEVAREVYSFDGVYEYKRATEVEMM